MSEVTIPLGAVLGDRFKIEAQLGRSSFGPTYQGRDIVNDVKIELQIIPQKWLENIEMSALHASCEKAARFHHPNLIATLGYGTSDEYGFFIALEWSDARPLPAYLRERVDHGSMLSLRGAYNIIAHLAKALTATQAVHGALRPNVIRIASNGRVKVFGFGYDALLIQHGNRGELHATDLASLSPELKRGADTNAASDIFGIGATLYQLLSGKSPAHGFTPPSQTHPEVSEEIDALMLRCLAAEPTNRFADADDIRKSLIPHVAQSRVQIEDKFDLEVDIDLSSFRPGPLSIPPQMPNLASGGIPAVPAPQRVDSPAAATPQRIDSPQAATPQRLSVADAISELTNDPTPKWMYTQDGMDCGPVNGRELAAAIVNGEIAPGDFVVNLSNNNRRPLEDWSELQPLLTQQQDRKRAKAKEDAIATAAQKEQRSGKLRLTMIALATVVLVGGVALYLLTRGAGADEDLVAANSGDLYQAGKIKVESGSALGRAKGRKRGGGGGGGGGSFVGSYEAAMNQAMELGDVTQAGGQKRLSGAQVSGVLNRHLNRIYNRCVPAEKARGGHLSSVKADIAIAGSGKVMGVSVRQGSGTFKKCVAGQIRSVRFPSFAAPRMGTSYSFGVD